MQAANPAAAGGGEMVVPDYETGDVTGSQPAASSSSGAPAEEPPDEATQRMAALLREHRGARYLACFFAALVPLNMARHVRVLPGSPDPISCHFRTDGLAAEAPQLTYIWFFVFWCAVLAIVSVTLSKALKFLVVVGMQTGTPSDDRGHQLSTLAIVYFATPTMVTLMLVNLAVIEANAEDSFVLPPSLGGPAMCPADTCKPCAVMVPLYFGCIAGYRFLGISSNTFCIFNRNTCGNRSIVIV